MGTPAFGAMMGMGFGIMLIGGLIFGGVMMRMVH